MVLQLFPRMAGRNESIAQTFRSGKTWISCLLGSVGGVEMAAKS